MFALFFRHTPTESGGSQFNNSPYYADVGEDGVD